jgi:hypothetical protein
MVTVAGTVRLESQKMAWDLQNMSEVNGFCKPIKHKKMLYFHNLVFPMGVAEPNNGQQ